MQSERVTRKGRRLAAQEHERGAVQSPRSKRSSTRTTTPGAQHAGGTTFFQHRVVHQPGRPEGSGFWQLTEAEGRRERLNRHHREAQGSIWQNANSSDDTQFIEPTTTTTRTTTTTTTTTTTQPGGATIYQVSVAPVVSDAWLDCVISTEATTTIDDRGKKPRRKWLFLTVVLAMVLLVALVLGLVLSQRSNDAHDSTLQLLSESEPTSQPTSQLSTNISTNISTRISTDRSPNVLSQSDSSRNTFCSIRCRLGRGASR